MPQMAPLWWETLYLQFIMTFILINVIIFYGVDSGMSVIRSGESTMYKGMDWEW
uniref:ATP synthase complex subunit 8 n=1 Tax=Neolethaeus assamensis TaxID=1589711 RepID=A0A343ISG8_9HEMI|nr:ATP synthase F0 subunit 8 [Neolethaeus assamensis]AST10193.1 ATP synthase F0 subunit 8 [Neolethaeus assamensis]